MNRFIIFLTRSMANWFQDAQVEHSFPSEHRGFDSPQNFYQCVMWKNCKKRCPFVAKQQYSTTLKWNEKRTMMYKSRSESWAWKIALHMCECFFCFGFSLQGARHTSRLIFRCWVVCMKDAALPRSVSKLSIDPIQRHSSYCLQCRWSNKKHNSKQRNRVL